MKKSRPFFSLRSKLRKNLFLKTNIPPLFLTLILSATVLIIANLYTIKTLSALRAGIRGETNYVKARIDEIRNIMMYIDTQNERYYRNYRDALDIHNNLTLARKLLVSGGSEDTIKAALIRSGNDAADGDDVLFMVRTMKNFGFIKTGLATWSKEDLETSYISSFAEQIHSRISQRPLPAEDKIALHLDFYHKTERDPKLRTRFSALLGRTARVLSLYIFYFNILIIVLILSLMTCISIILLRHLSRSGERLREKNRVLERTNSELDKFIYSASHDLRAPILTLRGLIEMSTDEAPALSPYFLLMNECLDKQDRYIREIINFSVNQGKKVNLSEVDFVNLAGEIVQEQLLMHAHEGIQIDQDLGVQSFIADQDRLKIILNSILSNAIQYRDLTKRKTLIHIKTRVHNDKVFLSISDNGIGIKEHHLHRIFDMFFVTDTKNRGSGVGLYTVKEAVEKLKGSIEVTSEPGVGTNVSVYLPLLSEKVA